MLSRSLYINPVPVLTIRPWMKSGMFPDRNYARQEHMDIIEIHDTGEGGPPRHPAGACVGYFGNGGEKGVDNGWGV